MKWAGVLALVLMTGACSGSATPQAHATSLNSAASPAVSPVAPGSPAASPAPVASPPPPTTPLARVDFACRLPFVRQVDPTHTAAGFITFPSGVFTVDPSASPTAVYYDAAISRWLPVGASAVAPDGLHYAFMTGGSPSLTPGPPRLHVVDAQTAVETVLNLDVPGSLPYGVIRYTGAGVYIGSGWEGTAFGYWRVDPASGATTALGTAEPIFDDGTGHAWRAVVDRHDPKPALSALSGEPLPNEIVRRDLASGLETVWFYRPGFNVALAGGFLDGGILALTEPPVGSTTAGHEYWIAAAPGRSTLVAQIEYGGATVADVHGLWMGSNDGVYMFTTDGRVRRVSATAGDPVNRCV